MNYHDYITIGFLLLPVAFVFSQWLHLRGKRQ